MSLGRRADVFDQRSTIDPFSLSDLIGPLRYMRSQQVSLSPSTSDKETEALNISPDPSPAQFKKSMDAERTIQYFQIEDGVEEGMQSTPRASRWAKPSYHLSEVVEVDSHIENTPSTPLPSSPINKPIGLNPSIWSLRKIKKIEQHHHQMQRPDSGFKSKIFGQLEALNQDLTLLRNKANTQQSPSFSPRPNETIYQSASPAIEKVIIQSQSHSPNQRSNMTVELASHKLSEKLMVSARKSLKEHNENQVFPLIEESADILLQENSNLSQASFQADLSKDSNTLSIHSKRSQSTREKLKKLEEELRDKQLALLRERGAKLALIRELEAKTEQIDKLEREIALELDTLQSQKQEIENRLNKRDKSCCKARNIEEIYKKEIEDKERLIQLMRQHLQHSEERRTNTLQVLQNLKGNFQVFCRIKKIDQVEARSAFAHETCAQELVLHETGKRNPTLFIFDTVFGESIDTRAVFDRLSPEIASVLDGKNISLINIGSSNSGRLETLLGFKEPTQDRSFSQNFPECWGLVQLILEMLINETVHRNIATLSLSGMDIELYLSCLDLTDERLGDLLGPMDREEEVQIQINKGKVTLPSIVRKKITNMREALEAIRLSTERRQEVATIDISKSMRSHSIYRIAICRRATGEQLGLLNIIDMGGAEKHSSDTTDTDCKRPVAITKPEKLKKIQKEASCINKSVTTLGRIIRLIKQQRSMGIKDLCIPYRESKLTRVLQDSIGGEAQTLMIVNINPSTKCVSQAKEILCFSSVACV